VGERRPSGRGAVSAGAPVVDRDLSKLAPRFREAVFEALADCATDGLDAYVYEAYRSNELQALYYTRGRPPTPEYPRPVTNARTNLYSWHGYGLAVDVISRSRNWGQPPEWFARVAAHFQVQGCRWGGEWRSPDPPHMQWGRCKPSPSIRARELLAAGGPLAVWEEVGAA
jgi:hypothetical protein